MISMAVAAMVDTLVNDCALFVPGLNRGRQGRARRAEAEAQPSGCVRCETCSAETIRHLRGDGMRGARRGAVLTGGVCTIWQ